jgi:large subunit ribosomal protein L31
MKDNIHPDYKVVDVTCACGSVFRAGTTKKVDVLKVDICNQCHPFYTGKQKIVDSGGRVDKFRKRYGLN